MKHTKISFTMSYTAADHGHAEAEFRLGMMYDETAASEASLANIYRSGLIIRNYYKYWRGRQAWPK